MYGKPSPEKSGNGCSGWYKGWHFRSILELSYMINVIERFNLQWESGELKKHAIKYKDYKNNDRNYFPDFIINDKYVVEVKPKKLWNTPLVSCKTKYAKKYCKKNGLKYKITCCTKITQEELISLYKNKLIKLNNKKYLKVLKKHIKNAK